MEIKVAMVRKNVTGRQLASRLGVSQTWMSTRLTGQTPIDVNDLDRIAVALDMPASDLLRSAEQQDGRAIARYLNVAERATRNGRPPNGTRPTPVRPAAPTRPDTPRPGDTRPTTRTAVLPRAARRRAA